MPKRITEELKQPINNSNTNNFNLKSKSQKLKTNKFYETSTKRNKFCNNVLKLREEVKYLLNPSIIVANVTKVFGKDAVLVKTSTEGK